MCQCLLLLLLLLLLGYISLTKTTTNQRNSEVGLEKPSNMSYQNRRWSKTTPLRC
ncbi:hypothetical protein PRUPE_2G318400 [Prunus persica]|uniref:Uncharacterized protein n=1 Tax=Prunus persica TaxID=3760 RepID=A0A251QST3_PRUPE|nr:hypothetical protein PRUPE_2G318400 [Prunus persica]